MSGESAYVRELADSIGPRPATTDAEARAADWIATVLESKGLEVSRQDIDVPRTDAWGQFITFVLSILAVALALVHLPVLPWVALLLAVIAAALLELDMLGRFTLASWLPKGPSQNIVAKHCPNTRRNEKARKIVVVANLDSARPSLVTGTGLVRSQTLIARLTLVASWLIALLLLAIALPWKPPFLPYLWYISLVPAVWLLFPAFVVLQRELVAKGSDGANADASGVAAMIGVVDRLLPEKGDVVIHAEPLASTPAPESVKWGAEPMPEDSVLRYTPSGPDDDLESAPGVAEDPDSWGDIEAGTGQSAFEGLDTASSRSAAPRSNRAGSSAYEPGEPHLPFGDDDLFGDAFADPTPSSSPRRTDNEPQPPAQSRAVFEDVEVAPAPAPSDAGSRKRGDAKPAGEDKGSVFGWLGVDNGWDAKRKGKEIGSWDRFDDDDDEAGWKGGSVSDGADLGPAVPSRGPEEYQDPRGGDQTFTGSARMDIEDPDFATEEIARIRRKVTQGTDRDLAEKEIWFVATGAGEIGGWGMKALLRDNEEELRDALFLGLYGVGTGSLAYIDAEGGPVGLKRSDRRLVSAAKRVARDNELPMKAATSRWAITDIGVVLRERYRGMSVMAFDINRRLGEWRSVRDTSDRVSEENLTAAADFLTALIREL